MTRRRQSVVLIGAGSVTFTQVLVADFARTCPPDGLRLALVDTNPDALDVVVRLARRMVELLRADVEVVASTDRRDVLPGAGVVVTTISVGGRRELAEEERAGRLTHPFSWELFRRWGAYPAPGDRHVVEFVPERFPGGRYYGRTLGVDAFSFEQTIASGDQRYARSARQAAGELPFDESHFPSAASSESEQLARMVDAIRRDTRQVFYVNAPNDGACPQLPPGALLELPAVATGRGFRTLQVGTLPPGLAALLARRAGVVELTAEAALRGDRGLFVEAVLADGAVTDPQRAGRMVDELLRAQDPFLGAATAG